MSNQPIKPIPGEFVSKLNERDQHTLFLLAVKINELVQAINKLQEDWEMSDD